MNKSKKAKYQKQAINLKKAENQMIEDKRKNTVNVFILLSPFITMFGITLYGMVH